MPRAARHTPGGFVYHALNRATARIKLFDKPADYGAFLRVFDAALEKHPLRVLGYCLMPTHWHVVLWPTKDGDMTAFLRGLTLTHSVRWQAHYHSVGSGGQRSTLACRLAGGDVAQERSHAWPVTTTVDWLPWVKEAQSEGELKRLRQSVARGTPFGSDA